MPDYSVGIDLIDLQHQKLINLMNDLFVAVSIHDKDQSLTDKLDELLNYVKAHFKLEEALMGEISYEELEKHVHYHNMLIDELGKLLAKATIDKTSTYFEVLRFLKNWIRSHILTEDMKYNKALPVVGFSIKDWEVQAAKG